MRNHFHPILQQTSTGCLIAASILCSANSVCAQDALRLDPYNSYHTQQHEMRMGVVDPYTGEFIDTESFIDTDYSKPHMSYQNAIQDSAANPGLTYQLGSMITLNLDPEARRFNSDINIGGKKDRSFKFRLNTRQIMARYVWKF